MKKIAWKISCLTILTLTSGATGQIQRHTWCEVPLEDGFTYGEGNGFSDRDSDHATVAMNNQKDVLVAFHSSRGYRTDDLDGSGLTWSGSMKQVEVAYYKYTGSGSVDSWEHLDTKLIGSVDWDPVLSTLQNTVKCERPDVVAVDDKFFVVWTRRYDSGISGQERQPSVLECAWIYESSNPNDKIGVIAHPSGDPGRGFQLDTHGLIGPFEVRECAGVADAVRLNNDDDDLLEVAVVYPHVLTYSGGISGSRTFELRVVTCSLKKSTSLVEKKDNYALITNTVPFNGEPTPGMLPSPGLILPDLAPSGENMAFWLTYERQKMKSVTGSPDDVPDGRIKLEYRKLDAITNSWDVEASKTFKGSADDWSWRRRPMISSYPEGSGKQYAAVAFSNVSSVAPLGTASPDVHFEIWE